MTTTASGGFDVTATASGGLAGRSVRWAVVGGIGVALAALTMAFSRGATSALPYFRDAERTPEWLSERDAQSVLTVAPFALVDQEERAVTEAALRDRITIIHFFFARCGDVCPTTTSNIQRVVSEIGPMSELQILSHSVTPARDSVRELRAFAAMHRIREPRWRLLTGDTATIYRLARESYFVRIGDGTTFGKKTIAHTESVSLVDGNGRVRGIYAGTVALEMQRLREDILALAREAKGPSAP